MVPEAGSCWSTISGQLVDRALLRGMARLMGAGLSLDHVCASRGLFRSSRNCSEISRRSEACHAGHGLASEQPPK